MSSFTIETVVAIANQTGAYFASLGDDPQVHTAALRKAIAEADVFFGLLPDGSTYLIKGERHLQVVANGSADAKSSINGIRCREAAEAEAMRQVLGDGSPNMRSTSRTRVRVVGGGT